MITGGRLDYRGGNPRMNASFSGMRGLKLVRGILMLKTKQPSPISGGHVGVVRRSVFNRCRWDYSERNILYGLENVRGHGCFAVE
ncbi:hypothetical protein CEXT_236511 [Caerostris extrusa]|uniref:Uncharacterized protein n=1 Tax=Caerostris extrusa TaxID=172846 RepID=A0AAV4UJX0_CAEEX|nr:hypothetical protein CEXT_236511 [Caerostris extrusa]